MQKLRKSTSSWSAVFAPGSQEMPNKCRMSLKSPFLRSAQTSACLTSPVSMCITNFCKHFLQLAQQRFSQVTMVNGGFQISVICFYKAEVVIDLVRLASSQRQFHFSMLSVPFLHSVHILLLLLIISSTSSSSNDGGTMISMAKLTQSWSSWPGGLFLMKAP